MTMQIQIHNLDSARTAKVEVQDFDMARRTIACVDEFRIGPGEGRSVYIHAARQFIVTEDPLATQIKPAAPPESQR